jgi:hypothetical protein
MCKLLFLKLFGEILKKKKKYRISKNESDIRYPALPDILQ